MAEIILYSSGFCAYCVRAKNLLTRKNAAFNEIRVDLQPEFLEEMIAKTGKRTVPQIFINGQYIGGCDELHALDAQGTLDQLLRG
ncbi:MAG: glutaredoxin 3 [Legionellales bacterium]